VAVTGPVWIKETAMKHLLLCFVKNDSGATAIEYSLICAGIAIAIVAAVQSIGPKLVSTFTTVQNGFN
jgi:pilus assembly protein Flp/PilA